MLTFRFMSLIFQIIITDMRLNMNLGFPGGTSGKESTCQCRRQKRCRFDPWVRWIPWRRAWQTTPVFSPIKSHEQRTPAGCRVTKSQTWLSGWEHKHELKLDRKSLYNFKNKCKKKKNLGFKCSIHTWLPCFFAGLVTVWFCPWSSLIPRQMRSRQEGRKELIKAYSPASGFKHLLWTE